MALSALPAEQRLLFVKRGTSSLDGHVLVVSRRRTVLLDSSGRRTFHEQSCADLVVWCGGRAITDLSVRAGRGTSPVKFWMGICNVIATRRPRHGSCNSIARPERGLLD